MQKIHRLFPYLAIVVTILSLVACGSSGGNTGTAVTPTPTSATATATPTPSTHHFMVGETVKVGDTWNDVILFASRHTPGTGQAFKIPLTDQLRQAFYRFGIQKTEDRRQKTD